jgi:hypothetical protein
MDDQQVTPADDRRGGLARWGRPGAFAAAGLVAGGLLAGSLSASADETSPTATPDSGGYAGAAPSQGRDPAQPQRPDEELLTGTTADKVEAAALAKYPGATVVRIETDSDGVYEAHLTKADGTPVTVEVDKSFAVTGTEQAGPGGRGGAPGGAGAGSPSASAGSYRA